MPDRSVEIRAFSLHQLNKELAFAHAANDESATAVEWYADLLKEKAKRMRVAEAKPDVTKLPDGVQVTFPKSRLKTSVRYNNANGEVGSYVEWGTNAGGNNGGDLIIDARGSAWFTFQESSRLFVMDGNGIRIYDGDMQKSEHLIVDMSHDEYFDNNRGFHVGPVIVERLLRNAIQAAADIVSEHGENSEFDRGVYNLLAELFGREDVPTDERMDELEKVVREVKPIQT